VANELLAAAEKYQMDELKDLCEEQLIASTDTGNAVAHFFLANRFKGQCHKIVFLSLLFMENTENSISEMMQENSKKHEHFLKGIFEATNTCSDSSGAQTQKLIFAAYLVSINLHYINWWYPDPPGTAFFWLSWIWICIGNANPDQGARILTKIYKKT
jgi:hypothetical protein